MTPSAADREPGSFDADVERRADGSMILRPRKSLPPYPARVTDALLQRETERPDSPFVAQRGAGDGWDVVTYRVAADRVRRIAAGLARYRLGPDRPLLILSGNGTDHLLLGLAAMYIGVPYCPVSPAYSQGSSGFRKLRYVADLLTPGMVAAFGDADLSTAIAAAIPGPVPLLSDRDRHVSNDTLDLAALASDDTSAATSLNEATGPDTIVKFLLTSGSTGSPKPVITTNRMLCSNQQMLRQALPFVVEEAPVLVDWLPWNHTFGGSHNVGLVLFNGGTLYIDDGRPLTGHFGRTIRNLEAVAPTIYFNVPVGFDLLATELQRNDRLRESLFSRLRAFFFAGASLSAGTRAALDAVAQRARGTQVPILSGLGCTEMSPSVTFTTAATGRAGVIGMPPAGCEIRLAPVAGKLELRARGPHRMPGYWRQPAATGAAFDEEGFYRLGDAVRLVDPDDPCAGMAFDGRIAEDFKLANGTWVSTGPLRAALVDALAPLARDVVVAGLDRDCVGILVVPDPGACAAAVGANDCDLADVLGDERLHDRIADALVRHAAGHPARSRHARRAILLAEPLSMDRGEITDKGSVNQRAVLDNRSSLVEALFAEPPGAGVISLP